MSGEIKINDKAKRVKLFFAFLTLIISPFHFIIAQTHVQTTWRFNTSGGVNTSTVFPASSTSGNLIVVHLSWDNQARTTNTVIDSKGNDYTKIHGPTNWDGTNYRSELWYAYNIAGGGAAITVSASLNAAPASFFQIYISEYSGIATSNPLDQNNVRIGSGNPCNSNTVTTVATNELVYGIAIGASGSLTNGTGFTSRSVANSNIVEDRNVAAAGTYSATFTSAGGNWVAEIATFKSTTSLPIELLDFTVECANNKAKLNWSTASERNNSYFTLERSTDGFNFSEITKINGAGTTQINSSYSYSDETVNEEVLYYYRLKQTDDDGELKYYKLITHICKAKSIKLSTFMDDTGNNLTLKISTPAEENILITLVNITGNIIYSSVQHVTDGVNLFKIDLSSLPQGLYLVQLKSNSSSLTTKFSK